MTSPQNRFFSRLVPRLVKEVVEFVVEFVVELVELVDVGGGACGG